MAIFSFSACEIAVINPDGEVDQTEFIVQFEKKEANNFTVKVNSTAISGSDPRSKISMFVSADAFVGINILSDELASLDVGAELCAQRDAEETCRTIQIPNGFVARKDTIHVLKLSVAQKITLPPVVANLCGNKEICPDGCLDKLYPSGGGEGGSYTTPGVYGIKSTRIPLGTTKKWCVPVGGKYLNSSNDLESIEVDVQNVPDDICAEYKGTLRQEFHPYAESTSLSLSAGKVWGKDEYRNPENAQRGLHTLTLSTVKIYSTTGYCALDPADAWSISWKVNYR